jgi:hypothetical protein
VEAELLEAKARADAELAAAEAQRRAEEKTRRDAFKAAHQARFEGK